MTSLAARAHTTRASRYQWIGDRLPHVIVGGAVVMLCASGLIFGSSTYAPDFTNGAWMIAYRAYQIEHGEWFSYFINVKSFGAFTPVWSFYGGPVVTLGGVWAVVLGGAWRAIDVLAVASWASAYGGTYWVARLCGAPRKTSHFPAICVVTSAYWITNAYGRGDWAEFVATSSIPLLVSSCAALLRDRNLRLAPVVAFTWSLWIFTGTHNITLLWGSIVIVMLLGALVIAGVRASVEWAAVRRVIGVAVVVVSTNLWFLVPDALYASTTIIGAQAVTMFASGTAAFNSAGVLFFPLRRVPKTSTTPALYVQLPVLFLASALVAICAAWSVGSQRQRRATLALAAVFVVLTVAVFYGVPTSLPKPLSDIQFSYRIVSYLTLVVACLVLASAVFSVRGGVRLRRIYGIAMVVVCGVGCGLATWQIWFAQSAMPGSLANRAEAVADPTIAPSSYYGYGDYRYSGDATLSEKAPRTITLPVSADVAQGVTSVALPSAPAGALFQTNIGGGPPFVKVGGDVQLVGRNQESFAIVRVERSGLAGETMTLSVTATPVFRVVEVISLVAVLALAVVVLFVGARSVWRWFGRERQ